jgi:hypothetical protein
VFSTRLPWDRAENALARQERARRDAGQPIVDLTASNPTRVGLAYPEQALRAALGGVAARGYARRGKRWRETTHRPGRWSTPIRSS